MLSITSLVKLKFYRTIAYFEKHREYIIEALAPSKKYTKYVLNKLGGGTKDWRHI